jgi:hypothetical protein
MFADPSINLCVNICTNYLFGNYITKKCEKTCPTDYYADFNSH